MLTSLEIENFKWARVAAGVRWSSPARFRAETGESARGSRLTQTETRFTDGEKLQTHLPRRARRGDARAASRISGAAVKRTVQGRFGSNVDRSYLSPDRMLNSAESPASVLTRGFQRCPATIAPAPSPRA